MGENKKEESLKDFWLGILITLGIFVIGLLSLFSSGYFPFALVFGPLLFIIIIILCFSKGKIRMGQGMLIGLGIVCLLVAACFGFVFYSFSRNY